MKLNASNATVSGELSARLAFASEAAAERSTKPSSGKNWA
jgi:hypothetical protein